MVTDAEASGPGQAEGVGGEADESSLLCVEMVPILSAEAPPDPAPA